MGDGNTRSLNIIGQMMGHSIGSDNHIRKKKLQENQTLLQLRQPLELMLCWKIKMKRKKEMSGRMVNIQHVTLNDMTPLTNLCMSIGT